MARAIEISRLGYPAPNPHVGCVIVRRGLIVGEGHHEFAGGPHAEAEALRQAGDAANGATVFVTLEPCNHHGRTPPCSDALLEARVARVVAACRDPIPKHAGGLERLRAAGVEIEAGFMEDEARAANRAWMTATARESPFVVVKAAMALDGRIANARGESKWITGEEARAEAHRLRAECGAVLVGRATVEADDPRLTVRSIPVVNQPLRIVIDLSRKLQASAKVFDDEAPSLRVVSRPALEGEIEMPMADGKADLSALMRELYRRNVTSLLVEGGGHTIGRFLEAGLADRLELFVAPKVFGAGVSWAEGDLSGFAQNFEIAKMRPIGNDAWISCVPKK